jgi:hypothetical protein
MAETTTLTAKPLPAGPASAAATLLTLSDDELAKRIDAHHDAIKKRKEDTKKAIDDLVGVAQRTIIEEALKAGEYLIEVKRREGHGKWGEWLKGHCKVSERTAQRYMLIKQEWPKIEKWLQDNNRRAADLSLREAERLLEPPKEEEPKDDAPTKHDDEVVVSDPLAGIRQLEDDLVTELKTLKRDNEARAKEATANIVRRFEDADLY